MNKIEKIKDDLIDQWGPACPLCPDNYVTNLHHIIPRSRTSKKHEAWWLWDERNLIVVCPTCDNPMLHTPTGIKRCLAVQKARHPDWDYSVDPWREYQED